MNFKRRKCRRHVRCVLCTPYRGQGNTPQRFKAKETALRRALERDRRLAS